MKHLRNIAFAGALLLGSAYSVLADNVRTDYDHGVNFTQYHTYSWGQVQTSDPFYVDRIKQAVDQLFVGVGRAVQGKRRRTPCGSKVGGQGGCAGNSQVETSGLEDHSAS